MLRFVKIISAAFILHVFTSGCSVYDFIGHHFIENQASAVSLGPERFGLYLSPKKEFPLNAFDQALDSLTAYQPLAQNFVFFVHGMGDYPNRIKYTRPFKHIIQKYAANVVLFKWPAWIDLHTIPRANARASAHYLHQELERWANRLQQDTSLSARRQILMTHSMGGAVLRNMMVNYKGDLPDSIFDALVIVAPETDLRGHARWVEKINFARKVYIFFDKDDPVLKPVRAYLKRARLGMQLTRLDGTPETLARNAVYIDVSAATDWHGYHLIRQNKKLEDIFRRIIQGDEYPLYDCTMPKKQVYAVPEE